MDKPILFNVLKPGNSRNIPVRSNVNVNVNITTKDNPEFHKENYKINLSKDMNKLHLFFMEALLKSAQQSVLSLQFPNGHGITNTEGLLPLVPVDQHEGFLIRIEITKVELFVNFVPSKLRNLHSKDDRIIKSLEYDYFTFYYRMLDQTLANNYKLILYDSIENKGYTNTPEVLSKIKASAIIYQLPLNKDLHSFCEDYTESTVVNKLRKVEHFNFEHTIGEGFEDPKIKKFGDLFEICLLGMTSLEEAHFIVEFKDQKLLFYIKLNSIENEKYWFECSDDDDRYKKALENQQKAEDFYLKDNNIASLLRYYNGMRYIEPSLVKATNNNNISEIFFERLEKFLYLKLKSIQILNKLGYKEEIKRKQEYLFTFEQIENMEKIGKYDKILSLLKESKSYNMS